MSEEKSSTKREVRYEQKTASESRLRLLHLEDNQDDYEIVKRSLSTNLPFEFQITNRQRGVDALQDLKSGQYDIVLVDFQLPDMTGLEFLRRLKALRLPVSPIFITGMGNLKVAVEAMKEGARNYIVKDQIGVNPKELAQTIIDHVLENAFPQGADKNELISILEMFAKSKRIDLRQATTASSQPPNRIDIAKLISQLESLCVAKLVEAIPSHTVVSCPSCDSIEYIPLLLCPECRSPFFEKEDTLKHISCGYVGFTRSYRREGDDYYCPSCEKRIGDTRLDYQKVGNWYLCENAHIIETPNTSFDCARCGKRFDFKSSRLYNMRSYRLSLEGEQKFRLVSSSKSL